MAEHHAASQHTQANAIDVMHLVKKFGDFTAVNDVSFSVREGEIFGLLGKNGAGKTTTISILVTILDKTSGEATIYGTDVSKQDAARKLIGIVFQDQSLDDELTAYDNLDFHARLYDVKKGKREIINNVLKLVDLSEKANNQVKTFSGGMKRRLEIARGLIHNPKVLFLDEPTTGLDPQTRRKIWAYVKELRDKHKMTIILTTHYLEEADFLCDRIAIMDKGKIIRIDTPDGLKAVVSDKKENPTLEDAFIHLTGDTIADDTGNVLHDQFAQRFRGRAR